MPLTDQDLGQLIKEHKLDSEISRPDAIKELATRKGWGSESPEVQEYLLAGGCITQLPACKTKRQLEEEAMTTEAKKTAAKKPTKKTTAKKAPAKKPAAKKSPAKKSPAKKVEKKVEKKSEENVVTLQEICESCGIETRVARRKLRFSDVKKPGKSWTWAANDGDVKKVVEVIKA